jgi:protein O-mannosyl-transferase
MEHSREQGPRSDRVLRLVPFVLALAVGVTYGNALHGGFHFDDWHVIQHNSSIRSLANLPGLFSDPELGSASQDNRTLRPLLLATFALNYAISGLEPWSYHLFNLLLHWIVVCLAFRIARDHLRLGDEAVALAGLIALVVATHPLATSAVNYVSARSAVLAAVFYLAAFDAAVRRRAVLALACFGLALLTKEHVVTLPLLVLAYDWARARRLAARR